MTCHDHYDALVVGARVAGAAAAMLMARSGMRVLVIDRGEYGSDTLSTHALMRGGVMQLHRWGLLPSIQASGAPAIRSTTFHYGDETVAIPIKPIADVDALYAPRRTLLDRVLVDAARAAGAEVRMRHAATQLVRDGRGRVCGAVVRDGDGEVRTVRAGLVVGADGAASLVAREAGAATRLRGEHAAAVIYGHWHGLARSGYEWFYRPGVSAGVIPTNDGTCCVFASVPAWRYKDQLRHTLDAGYRRVLAEAAPELARELAEAPPPARLWAFAGRPGYMRQAWGPGWALIGDAGYFKDPLTAHGITDALRDAELLANAARDRRPAAFEAFEATRDALSRPLFQATETVASFAWDLESIRPMHQALNAAMRQEVEFLSSLADPVTAPPAEEYAA